MSEFFRVEGLKVYQMLVQLHLEISTISLQWPAFERFELGAQVRRSSNSSPANLAEKHSDRHLRNKIEGVNRARTEALETVHHLFIAHRKCYLDENSYQLFRERYEECIRMLNGLERTLERQLDKKEHRFTTDDRRTEPF